MSEEVKSYFGGIEGGGTGSVAVILSQDGRIVGRSAGPGTNHWLIGLDKCLSIVNDMIEDAKRAAGIDVHTPLVSLGLSLSGMDNKQTQKDAVTAMKSKFPHCSIDYHMCVDTVGAITTASDRGGVVLISGTGSNCQVLNPNGETHHCGGWGHMMGDEGSAYWIAQHGIKTVFDAEDRLAEPPHSTTYVKKAMFDYFKIDNLKGMLEHLYGHFDKSRYAGFCKVISQGAKDAKDPLCLDIFNKAGCLLGRHVRALAPDIDKSLLERKGGLQIICVGSVWLSWDLLQDGFLEGLRPQPQDEAHVQCFSLVKLRESSAVGAAILGSRTSGHVLPVDYSTMAQEFFSHTY